MLHCEFLTHPPLLQVCCRSLRECTGQAKSSVVCGVRECCWVVLRCVALRRSSPSNSAFRNAVNALFSRTVASAVESCRVVRFCVMLCCAILCRVVPSLLIFFPNCLAFRNAVLSEGSQLVVLAVASCVVLSHVASSRVALSRRVSCRVVSSRLVSFRLVSSSFR